MNTENNILINIVNKLLKKYDSTLLVEKDKNILMAKKSIIMTLNYDYENENNIKHVKYGNITYPSFINNDSNTSNNEQNGYPKRL